MFICFAAVCAAAFSATSAQASLVGDVVNVHISVPNIGGWNQTLSTTVTEDASDALVFTSGLGDVITVDPFGAGFVLTNTAGTGFNVGAGALV
jgi:opacity protein-like surface antigen